MTVLNFSEIGKAAAESDSVERKIVKGRTLQYDADFACYEVSNLDEPVTKSFKRLLEVIEFKRKLAGAEFVNAYITLGRKSGREEMATVQEYQAQRDPDKPIKVRVRELRAMLYEYTGEVCNVISSLEHEADDMMCMLQTEAIRENKDSSVIMSGDKDLWMVRGWHCDDKTGRMYSVNGYGETGYREVGNVKPKLVGEGTSWFWHQMIMGDTVDNIPGLPRITNNMLDRYTPLKSGRRKAGSGLCGEAKAVAVLDGVTNDFAAAARVAELYREFYNIEWVDRFMEQGYLLWMQRTLDGYDFEHFLTSIGANKALVFSRDQCLVIDAYNKRIQGN